MIIRMTVDDNDFTELLEDFADNLREHFFQETKSLRDDCSPEAFHTLITTEETIRQTLWADSIKEVTEEGKISLSIKKAVAPDKKPAEHRRREHKTYQQPKPDSDVR